MRNTIVIPADDLINDYQEIVLTCKDALNAHRGGHIKARVCAAVVDSCMTTIEELAVPCMNALRRITPSLPKYHDILYALGTAQRAISELSYSIDGIGPDD